MKQKRAEAMYTDQRLGYVNDMVVGARTIKCYGWESNYLQKVKEGRSKQLWPLFWSNFVASLGISFYANMGLVAIFIIFMLKWSRGEVFNLQESFSLLAIIFYTFISVGQLTWLGIVNGAIFMAVLKRMSSVMRLEEHEIRKEADTGEAS